MILSENLIKIAKEVGIAVPENTENYISEQYPYWHCLWFISAFIDERMLIDSARMLSIFDVETVLSLTYEDCQVRELI